MRDWNGRHETVVIGAQPLVLCRLVVHLPPQLVLVHAPYPHLTDFESAMRSNLRRH